MLVFLPFAVGLVLAFFAHRQGDWTFVGLANFADILAARNYGFTQPMSFYFALGVTLLWTVLNVALHLGIGLALALVLNRSTLRLRPLYRVLLILPWAVPNYITALIWKGLFHKQFGAINGFLEWLGLDAVSWFSSFGTAFFAINEFEQNPLRQPGGELGPPEGHREGAAATPEASPRHCAGETRPASV